jgi:DNA-binding NtrC family response regulator
MGRILLIEDEQSAQLLFRNRLEDLGHEVIIAPTGARGLMEARTGTFDLFLVDVVLGSGIDGFEVCRRIKTIPQVQRIPIVLIRGQLRGREDLHRGYEAGCEAFLLKGDLPLLEDVVRAMLNIKALQDDLAMQNRLLEDQNRRLTQERQRGADLELALRESGHRSSVFRELAAGRPDGILLVDADGIVLFADRGAIDVLGKELEGRNLGSLAPASGLEAFVRDARNEPREGFRFDLSLRGGKITRSLSASVIPIAPISGSEPGDLRAVLILDAGKRRVAAELLRLEEQGIPRREIGALLEAARSAFHPSRILGLAPAMVALRRVVAVAARTGQNALVRGEPGTGKEFVARSLHFAGRRSGVFVPVNCAALAPDLLASELFGHVKGSSEGAVSDRPGLLHQAHLGTLLLDEVDSIPLIEQAKLVRALVDGEVLRVGATRADHVDVRVIATTSAPLERMVAEGTFDPALLAVISQVSIVVPPLRERRGDVMHLAQRFLEILASEREELAFSPTAAAAMERYDWPGNVRELMSCVERAVALSGGSTLEVEHLPQALRDLAGDDLGVLHIPAVARPAHPVPGTHSALVLNHHFVSPEAEHKDAIARPPGTDISLQSYEKACILAALLETRGDKQKAARMLKVGKSTFYRKLKAHGLT